MADNDDTLESLLDVIAQEEREQAEQSIQRKLAEMKKLEESYIIILRVNISFHIKFVLCLERQYESDAIVCDACTLRVDPSRRIISKEQLNLKLRRYMVTPLNEVHSYQNDGNKECVIIGILALKRILFAKNDNKYLMIKIDDFESSVACFIFSRAIRKNFFTIPIGTVLAIANPKSFHHKKKPNQHEIGIGLKIECLSQILHIGNSIDIKFCNKLKANGDICKNIMHIESNNAWCRYHTSNPSLHNRLFRNKYKFKQGHIKRRIQLKHKPLMRMGVKLNNKTQTTSSVAQRFQSSTRFSKRHKQIQAQSIRNTVSSKPRSDLNQSKSFEPDNNHPPDMG